MVKRLGIFTAGGLARAVASHFGDKYKVSFFIDEPKVSGETIFNIPVINEPPTEPNWWTDYVIGCGEPSRRKTLAEKNVNWTTLVHKTANVSTYADVGLGSIVCPCVGIDPQVKIGKHVYVDYNSVIGHGAEIGDYTVIGPLVLVAGYCVIGNGAYIGAGAKIVKEAKIGNNSIIGAGAVVLKDVPPNEVWAGVPAKKLRGFASE